MIFLLKVPTVHLLIPTFLSFDSHSVVFWLYSGQFNPDAFLKHFFQCTYVRPASQLIWLHLIISSYLRMSRHYIVILMRSYFKIVSLINIFLFWPNYFKIVCYLNLTSYFKIFHGNYFSSTWSCCNTWISPTEINKVELMK